MRHFAARGLKMRINLAGFFHAAASDLPVKLWPLTNLRIWGPSKIPALILSLLRAGKVFAIKVMLWSIQRFIKSFAKFDVQRRKYDPISINQRFIDHGLWSNIHVFPIRPMLLFPLVLFVSAVPQTVRGFFAVGQFTVKKKASFG